MKELHPRERKLLIATLLVGTLAVMQMSVIGPGVKKIQRLKTKVAVVSAELGRMRSTLARKEAVESAYEEIRNRITSNKTAEREIIDMLLLVEDSARKAGVEILENVHTNDQALPNLTRHVVRFRGTGEIGPLLTMLHALESHTVPLRIPKMEFSIKDYKLEMVIEIIRVVHVTGQKA